MLRPYALLSLLLPLAALAQPCANNTANFSVLPNGNTVLFSANTTPAADGYVWNFGDGAFGFGLQASHTYGQPGEYSVCLGAWWYFNGGQDSCWVEHCEAFVLGGPEVCDPTFVVEFGSQTNGNVVAFSGIADRPTEGMIWDFGDGTQAFGPVVSHTYSDPGMYQVCLSAWYWNVAISDSCWTETCEQITIGGIDPCEDLAVDFTWNITPDGVQFSNSTTGTGGSTTWFWSFGDNTGSNQPQPFHAYTEPGNYHVCLTAISVYELPDEFITCEETTCVFIQIGEDPCADVDACILVNDLGSGTFLFENCSSPIQNAQFLWDLGDGNSSSDVIVDHAYSTPGTYTVCLTIFWQTCRDSTCTTVTVLGGTDPCDSLEAGFVHNTVQGTTQFSNATTGTGLDTQFFWDFGDGNTSTMAQPFHTYGQPGDYEACLQVVSIYQLQNGSLHTCIDTTCAVVSIGGPCDALTAEFIGSGGLGVNFANAVIDLSWTYFWEFGDGTVGDGPNPFHTYPEAGSYEVCLTVWTWDPEAQDTCFVSNCEVIQVQGGDPCAFLMACFVPSPSGGNSVFFNNCTPNEFGTQFFWDFGDGSTSNDLAPTHEFPEAGDYTVCLTAVWQNCADSTCITVSVGGPGCFGFTTSFEVQYQNNAVVFFGSSSMPALGMNWSFGDGTFGEGTVITHLYEPPGPFEVCLESWYYDEQGQDSCFAQSCQLVDPFGPVGISDARTVADVRLFPQPAHGQLTISGAALKAGVPVRLLGMDGRLEHQELASGPVHQLDLSGIAPAMHILQLEIDGQGFNYKVVVE